MKIGLPRSMYYYYRGWFLKEFFEHLGCEVVLSKNTNRFMIEKGMELANDEMCLSLKLFLGHVASLKGHCDYLVVPRIDNYGLEDQTCTNFLALPDLVCTYFEGEILEYTIDIRKKQSELKGLIALGKKLGFDRYEVMDAYYFAKGKEKDYLEKEYQHSMRQLKSPLKKILLVGHPYNLYDPFIGCEITSMLKKMNVEVLYSDKWNRKLTNKYAYLYSKCIYFKYNKEAIGSIKLLESKIDGVIFLSTFPCGPDSLVNELIMRKLDLPTLNLIVDDLDALAGMETRLESFLDIINEK